MALETAAPQAQRSSRHAGPSDGHGPGVTRRAGKPSMLCSSPGWSSNRAASSGCPPVPPGPGLRSGDGPAIWPRNPAGHRHCIGHRRRRLKAGHEGAVDALLELPKQRRWPQPPAAPSPRRRPDGCRSAAVPDVGAARGAGVAPAGPSRLLAKGRRARPTPDAGRGAALITAQSPLANRDGCPSTLRQRSVRIRPSGSGQTGCCEPGGTLAAGAERAGSAGVAVVVDQGDVCLSQQLLRAESSCPGRCCSSRARCASAAAALHFQPGCSCADHPQGRGVHGSSLSEGERRFQGLDWHPSGARSADGTHPG